MRRIVTFSGLAVAAIFALAGCGGSAASLFDSVITPIITGVSPNTVAAGGSITITGASLNGTSTTASFAYSSGSVAAQSTASSGNTTSVSVVVPNSLASGTYNVYVNTTDTSGDVSGNSNAVTLVVQ